MTTGWASVEARATRRARNALWSSPVRTLADAVAHQRDAHQRAVLLVRAYYALGLLWLVLEMRTWPRLLDVSTVEPQWPAAWLDAVDLRTGIWLIFGFHLATGLAAALVPQSRLVRIGYAVGLLQYLSFVNGFGKVNGNLHCWLYVAIVLVFLPRVGWRGPTSVGDRQRFLGMIWASQVVVMMTYTLTGIWKVGYALYDLVGSERTSSLAIDGFSTILVSRILETDQETLLGEGLAGLPAVGWLLFIGTMYLETASILIPFRPRLHRAWGVALMSFHLGTQLTMGFTFVQNIALVGLLMVCSPAAPDRVEVRAALGDLPGVLLARRTWRRVHVRRRRTAEVVVPARPESTAGTA